MKMTMTEWVHVILDMVIGRRRRKITDWCTWLFKQQLHPEDWFFRDVPKVSTRGRSMASCLRRLQGIAQICNKAGRILWGKRHDDERCGIDCAMLGAFEREHGVVLRNDGYM